MISVNVVKQLSSIKIDASFELTAGCTALSGLSGAGKTSIINMIAGLLKPDSGRISVDSTVLYDSKNKIDLPPDKRHAGYVFQESRLFPHMTVLKNLTYGIKNNNKQIATLDNITELLGINPLLNRYPKNLSGGEKQRVALGRALLSSPEFLLMDEPMASLDSFRREELLNYIAIVKTSFKIPVIYVTHTLDEIMRIADFLGVVEAGSLTRYGSTVDILNSDEFTSNLPEKEFGVVCEAIVTQRNKSAAYAILNFYGKELEVACSDFTVGTRVRFRIPAMDVVLSREVVATSARNVYPATVIGITYRDHAVDVQTDIGGFAIWARISKHSCSEMRLKQGTKVYTVIKSVVASQSLYRVS